MDACAGNENQLTTAPHSFLELGMKRRPRAPGRLELEDAGTGVEWIPARQLHTPDGWEPVRKP